jgi:hypothetical protein
MRFEEYVSFDFEAFLLIFPGRQRDNTIKDLQERIGGLQTSLACHLKAEECRLFLYHSSLLTMSH